MLLVATHLNRETSKIKTIALTSKGYQEKAQ